MAVGVAMGSVKLKNTGRITQAEKHKGPLTISNLGQNFFSFIRRSARYAFIEIYPIIETPTKDAYFRISARTLIAFPQFARKAYSASAVNIVIFCLSYFKSALFGKRKTIAKMLTVFYSLTSYIFKFV